MPEHDEPTGETEIGAQPDARGETKPERAAELFGRGVRTALRNNATAYGFSISITASYGLVNGARGSAAALDTISFALGAAFAFCVVGAVFLVRFPEGSLPEGGQIATISGGIDLLSIVAAVGVAFGVSRVPGFAAWPLAGVGTVVSYLLTSGLDILLARTVARRTTLGRSQ